VGVKTADDCVTNCHRCDRPFVPADVRATAYRDGRFWFECIECFDIQGGVTWVGTPPKYKRVEEER